MNPKIAVSLLVVSAFLLPVMWRQTLNPTSNIIETSIFLGPPVKKPLKREVRIGPQAFPALQALSRPDSDEGARTAWSQFLEWLESEDVPRPERIDALRVVVGSVISPAMLAAFLERIRASMPGFPEVATDLVALADLADTPERNAALVEALALAGSDNSSAESRAARSTGAEYVKGQLLSSNATADLISHLVEFVPDLLQDPQDAMALLRLFSARTPAEPELVTPLTQAWTTLAFRSEAGQEQVAPVLLAHFLKHGMTLQAQEFLLAEINTADDLWPELRPLIHDLLEKSRPEPDVDDLFSQWLLAMGKMDDVDTEGSIFVSFLTDQNSPLEKAAIIHSNPESVAGRYLLPEGTIQQLQAELQGAFQTTAVEKYKDLLGWAIERLEANPSEGVPAE